MNVNIPLDKAKNLAREINSTVHAGTEVAKTLNDFIATCPEGKDIPISYNIMGEYSLTDTIAELFFFYDEVGMLDD